MCGPRVTAGFDKGDGRFCFHGAVRVIPCLDIDDGRVVKGVAFRDLRDAGDPVELARRYYEQGADELTFLDVGASHRQRDILVRVVQAVSRQVFIPLTVGGGLRSLDDMRRVLRAGADKVSLGTAALADPDLLAAGSARFGRQCMVLSIDARREGEAWRVYSHGGRRPTTWDAVAWARHGEACGAGEILLNSIDRDGGGAGYDLELLRRVSAAVTIPVIASGGAGSPAQAGDAVRSGADAVLLASRLHDGTYTVNDFKQYLSTQGVNVRC